MPSGDDDASDGGGSDNESQNSSTSASDSEERSSVTSVATSSVTVRSSVTAESSVTARTDEGGSEQQAEDDEEEDVPASLPDVRAPAAARKAGRGRKSVSGGLYNPRNASLSQYLHDATPHYVPPRKAIENPRDRTRFLIWAHRTTAPAGYTTRAQRARDNKPDTDSEQILRLRIDARRKSIAQARQRIAELKEDNQRLKAEVEKFDNECIHSVNGILDRNVKIHGALSILGRNYEVQLSRAKQAAARDIAHATRLLEDVQREHDRTKQLAEERKAESIDVAAYKNDGYPRLQAQIRELEQSVERLKVQHAAEVEELLADFARDGKAAEAFVDSIQQGIAAKVTEKAAMLKRAFAVDPQHTLTLMDADTRELALENMFMRREMAAHNEALAQLEREIAAIEETNSRIALENRTNIDPRRRVLLEMQRERPSIEQLFDDSVL